MPIDPSFLPPAASPEEFTAPAPAVSVPLEETARLPRNAPERTPHIGHTLLFGVLVGLAGFVVGLVFALVLMHAGPRLHESNEQLQTDPRIVIPVEAIVYAIAAGVSFLIFPLFWNRSFAVGIHWRAFIVRQRWWLFAGIGVATSVAVQLLSNFLPIPKELPIDKFFTHRLGVWLIAIFGVTVAPAFEELAFRGFLLPSLASAWDWVALRLQAPPQEAHEPAAAVEFRSYAPFSTDRPDHDSDPSWSMAALIFSTVITSIGFALMHGAQLAHSFAPLAVLFTVSVVLCVTRLRFHSLAASTLVHSMYNATIFAMLFIGTDGFQHLDKLGK